MTITRRELIEAFGAACENGNAGVFVGAGMSKGAGKPDWSALLEAPRDALGLPPITDLPLLAEYILTDGKYTRDWLVQQVLSELREPMDVLTGAATHRALVRLPVDQIWTTNYDSLIERAIRGVGEAPAVIATDGDIQLIGSSRKSVVKMHGSIDDIGHDPRWSAAPVLTRSDFERYEIERPRTWALLRAIYLSKTLLFLGFSFTDPNIEILQRLARLSDTADHDKHLAIMKRPPNDKPNEQRFFDLRARDLERSGVRIHTIEDYVEVELVLGSLVRRTRPPQLFISGSSPEEIDYDRCCGAIAAVLVNRSEWVLTSLGGDAGWRVSKEVAAARRAKKSYEAESLRFYFRWKDDVPPEMNARVGTAVFGDQDRESLVRELLDESRAVLVLGGGKRTAEEVKWALELGAGVIPFAVSGGYARTYWEECRNDPPDLGGQRTDLDVWERLGHENPTIAADAASDLLRQAMYSIETC